ncbi:ImmA/IrrE family metallo-endopeptidase [Brevibacterium sediminis]|uniref:ImmA/IrrE family metallo-endopeptidase n=1 Tax=Brevibacterium sediminis TaxID=1857024 RepID=A0A5C4X2V1_9MICO|nr:ImmA/IrrE family metallo-endopeptidase [Brevibacterium sediminis]TNM55888.1 ImmA/IrrE family metallo-endopeptidase [Brevibacterium sediminis]
MNQLFALAESQGITVQEAELRTFRGFYVPAYRTVVLSSLLNEVQKRSTFAHELGHAYYGDSTAPSDQVAEFQERRANEWAAELLIDPYEYERAETLYGPHPGGLAQALGVTRELVEAFRMTFARCA